MKLIVFLLGLFYQTAFSASKPSVIHLKPNESMPWLWLLVIIFLLVALLILYLFKSYKNILPFKTKSSSLILKASLGQKLRLSPQSVLIEVIIDGQSHYLVESPLNIKQLTCLNDINTNTDIPT